MYTPLHVEGKLCENISIAQIKAKYAGLWKLLKIKWQRVKIFGKPFVLTFQSTVTFFIDVLIDWNLCYISNICVLPPRLLLVIVILLWWRHPPEERALWLAELLPPSGRPVIHVKVSNRAIRYLQLEEYCRSKHFLAKYERPRSDSRPSASAIHRNRVSKTEISAAGASNDWSLLGKISFTLARQLFASPL